MADRQLDAPCVPAGQEEQDVSKPWYRSLPYMTKGDVDAFIGVFSNNLANMLIAVGLVQDIFGDKITYNFVVPGIGVSMFCGCVFYALQAQLKSAKTGRQDLCAQPFGISTPGIFVFASIVTDVFNANTGNPDAGRIAWKVSCLANVIQGLMEILLSFFGTAIIRVVPMVALLGSLASVGLAFLFTNSFIGEVYAPLVGFVPFYVIMMAIYANVKLPKVPAMLPPVLIGTAFAWIRRQPTVVSVEGLHQSMDILGWHFGGPTLEPFNNLQEVASYLPSVIPVSLVTAVGTIQCREVTRQAGDEYNLTASMLGDGIATIISGLFGCPFGMTVFIGHPGFKAMGAKIGYNYLCGLGFLVVCFSGMAGLLQAAIPPQALNPILLFIGLAICSDALEVTAVRHWPALMLSLVPAFCNWAVTQAFHFADGICMQQPDGQGCKVSPFGENGWVLQNSAHTGADLRGMYLLGQGYMLTSIILTSMLVYVIDRKFAMAAGWALLAAVCASIGLIHSETLFFPWTGPQKPEGLVAEVQFDLHWDFTAAYGGCCLVFLFAYMLQRAGKIPTGPMKDEEDDRVTITNGSQILLDNQV